MNAPASNAVAPPPLPPVDALRNLNDLRGALYDLHPRELNKALPALSTAIDQVVAEHQGMADELLCVYEQLGIVFEVTRKLSGVHNESQVISLFLESLRRSFAGRRVVLARPGRSGDWTVDDPAFSVTAWLSSRCQRACERRAVLVEPVETGHMPDGAAEIMIGAVRSGDKLVCALLITRPNTAPAFKASEMMLVDSLTTFCGDLIRSHHLVRELREMSIAMVRSLVSAVDQKDEYTCGHSLRVAHYATSLGRRLGLNELDLQMLQWSALLHDVGKIGIRDAVLKKEGKLTAEEFDHIKEHPVRSHKVVQQVPQLGAALDGILHHHERYDGSGYPAGLKGEEIPLQARIIQIADVFDALTSNRSYRKAYDWQRALAIMAEEAGKTIDPGMQVTFDGLIRESIRVNAGRDESGSHLGWDRLVEQANQANPTVDEGSKPTPGE